jgi:RNA polymerase sigma-70 factor (ECF subfamily)
MSPRKSKSPQPLRLVPGSAAEKATERWTWKDSDLVAAVQAGDTAVASVLCDRLWPQVDRTIRRLLGRADADHDDIAQISLIEIVKTIGRYRGECSLDRWAQTVTAHVVFKHIRGKSAERRAFANLLDDDSFSVPAGFDRRLLVRQLLDRITGHLDQMNEPRAWAFLLHDALGYDLQEVAEMTGTSVAAAQSRLSRGRRELHERLGRDPELAELLRVEGGE